MKELLVLDLDDTLVDTSDVYWTARSRFLDILKREGISPEIALETFESFDSANMQLHGFAPERYLFTMQETYRHFAVQGGIRVARTIDAEIEEIGKTIWSRVPDLIDGARELLAWARSRFRLCLLSRGIPPVQLRKLEHHSLMPYFEVIRIVERKTASEFQQVLTATQSDAGMSWAIGDSIRSDINPGLDVGMRCILYVYTHHSYHWRQEYGEAARGWFYKVTSLVDAIPILEEPELFTKVSTI